MCLHLPTAAEVGRAPPVRYARSNIARGMETLFIIVSFALFAAVIVTMVRIVRDVFPHLDERDRVSFSGLVHFSTVNISSALTNAWKEHIRLFPKSRKRLIFAFLLIVAFLSVMGYPLWLALNPR